MDTRLDEAMLGRDAEEWLTTPMGQYVIGCCEQEIAAAQEKLAKVSPWRRRRITELQNEIWRAQAFKGWLAEMITAGRAAMHSLDSE